MAATTTTISTHPACFKSSATGTPARNQKDGSAFSFMALDFDQTTDEKANHHFPVPFCEAATTLPTQTFWRCAGTSNAVRWDHNGDVDQTTTTVSFTAASATDTAIGTTLFLNAVAVSPAANPGADQMILSQINRDADNAADTLAEDAQWMGCYYSMAGVDTLGFGPEFILEAGAAAMGAGGTTLAEIYADPNDADCVSFPNGGGYADYVFTLPPYFTGSLEITTWVNPGDTGTTEWRHDLRYVGLGEAFDGAITAGSAFTITGGSATTFYQDKQRAAVAGAAAGDTVILRVRRTANGTSTAAAKLLGVHINYDAGASLAVIPLSPQSLIPRTADPGSIVEVTGANFNYYAGRFASGSTTTLCGQLTIRGSSYLGGGKLRVRWISSGQGSLQLKGLYGKCTGIGGQETTTNPSATDPGTVTKASGGAGVLNETVIALNGAGITLPSTGVFVFLIAFQRQSGDDIPANVDIVDAWWEYIPK